jgi:hypothetical protein
MRKLEVKVRYIIWAIKESFKPTTYDLVEYKENYFYIKSSQTGYDIWNLSLKGSKNSTYNYIKGKDLKIVHSFKRFKRVFKQHLRFQNTTWYSIDIRKPLGTKICYINSNNICF